MPVTDVLNQHPELEVGLKDDVAADDDAPAGSAILSRKGADSVARVEWIQKEKARAMPHVEKFRKNYRQARRFYDGNQLSDEDRAVLKSQQRPDTAFNSSQKFVRYVTGIEREAPEALIFGPVDESDDGQQKLSEHTTRSYDWAVSKASTDFERSISFEDLILGGMGWMDYYIERYRDPRGLPASCRIEPEEMIWPMTSRQNLEGTRWRARESYVDVEELCARFPKDAALIRAYAGGGHSGPRPEAENPVRYTQTPSATNAGETKPLDGQTTQEGMEGKVPILEWQYYEDVAGYYFYDPLEKEDIWLDEKTFGIYKDRLPKVTKEEGLAGLEITNYIEQTRRVYKKTFVMGDLELGEPIEMAGNCFTFLCMTGSYNAEEKLWYGYFNVVIDPQKYANKFFNQVLELMGIQAKGGLLFEEGALKASDVKRLQADYAKAGSVNQVPRGAISGKKILFKPLPEMPVATLGILEFCVKSMDNVTGISPDSFGQGMANVPGVTQRQRAKSSLVLLAREFDALSRFRIEEGKVMFELLKTLADDRLIRVGGAFDGEVIKLMREPFALDYELMLDDTERDPNVRKTYQENMVAIMPTLIRMEWFAPEFIDYLTLPYKAKQTLKRAIKEMAQAKMEAARRGEGGGGRGARMTPEERQAKIMKTAADIQVQQVKAKNIEGRTRRDAVRTILETLTRQQEMRLEREKHSAEMAMQATELFARATGRDSAAKTTTARPKTKKRQPRESEAEA